MDIVPVIAFVAGLTVGGILCALGAQSGWRRVRRETAERMEQSNEIQEHHYSITAMTYRSALESLEGGNFEVAKKQLSDSIAIFYQTKTEGRSRLASVGIQPKEPDWTGRELRAIEQDARRFESLRAALARKQSEPAC